MTWLADEPKSYQPSVRVPDPRTKRSAITRVLASLFVVAAVVALLAGVALFIGYSYYSAPGPLTAAKTVEIKRGLRTPEIGLALEDAGIISNAGLFSAAAYLTGSRGRLKAGEYQFPANVSMRDALDIITSGKALTYKLLIPEGVTVQQALERIRNQTVLTGEVTDIPPEGMIMPDTHVFARGITRDELVADMRAAQEKLIAELWEERAKDLPFDTKEEALTLASIVEKETARADERPRVASVFVNRLRQKMRLQSDPTIIYGIVGGKGRLDRPITKKDIAEKTPYNTYRINGLPPGPISNPGRAALEAVLNPPTTKDLYFVADGTGGHAFAETLEQHRANVENWRKIERERKAGQEAEDIADAKTETGDQPAAAAADPEKSADTDEGQTAIATSDGNSTTPEAKATTPETKPATPEAEPTAALGEPAQPATIPLPEPDAEAETAAAPIPMPPAETVATPVPQPKPTRDVATLVEGITAESIAAAEPPAAKAPLAPGDVVTVADRLVPIPVPKPKP